MLKNPRSMHEQVLVAHGVNKYIHTTRFKDCLLESIPGLCESRNGQDILLSLDGEARRTLFEACESSCIKNSMVLAKAAHIIRHDIVTAGFVKQAFTNRNVLLENNKSLQQNYKC